ncbi:unnamed protein product [Ilex paraguariensis]|uniref:Uncharacterized protein n=1 Tax=Ilex paraguariensis TaxID=185542 RepID=A0ABC8SPZ4_9AQUA
MSSSSFLVMANAARTTLFHRGWTNLFGQFNAAYINMRFDFSEGQRASPSCHDILTFIVPVIIALLQLKDKTPFDTHPKTMCVVSTSLLLYGVLSMLRFSSPTYASIVHHGTRLFGFLLLASLTSTLFPDPVSLVLYAMFIMLSASGFEEPGGGRPMAQRFISSQKHRAHAFPNERNRLPV